MTMRVHIAGLVACAFAAGCGDEGDLRIVITAEETISEGIEAGDGEEDIRDGWNVQYDKLIVGIGDVSIARSGSAEEYEEPSITVIDLVQLPTSGFTLLELSGLAAKRWDRVSYALRAPDGNAVVHSSVSDADRDAMIAGGCTYLIAGTISPAPGSAAQSTPPGGVARTVPSSGITFNLCVPADVHFTSCQSDDVPGVAIPGGGVGTAALTLHGDHPFFPSFIEGDELVMRRAQWLVNSDTNGDNVVTREELETITGASLVTLFPADLDPGTPGNQGYSLTGAVGGPITSAFEFLVAQLRTQGHLNGEGECEPIVH